MIFFFEYLVPVMCDIDHPTLIGEWKKNIDATAYENNLYKAVKLPSIKKILIVMIKYNTGQKS